MGPPLFPFVKVDPFKTKRAPFFRSPVALGSRFYVRREEWVTSLAAPFRPLVTLLLTIQPPSNTP